MLQFSRVALLALLCAGAAQAATLNDPFSTEQGITDSRLIGNRTSACLKIRTSGPFSLSDIVERTLCNNPQTASAWAAARAQAAQLGIAKSAYLPTASATVSGSRARSSSDLVTGHGYTNSSDTSLGLNYLLYDFGARAASLENAKQLLIAANAARDTTLQTLFLTAVQDYYALFSAQESVKAYRQSEESAAQSLAVAQGKLIAGVSTKADVLQAQTALSQATYNRIKAEGDVQNARGQLAVLMALSPTTPLAVTPPRSITFDARTGTDLEKLIQEARSNRPDLVAANAQVRAAQAAIDLANAQGKPTISLGVATDWAYSEVNQHSHNSSIGVTLSVPIFTGYKSTYSVRAAEAQLDARKAERDNTANQIALDVWKAYQNLLTNNAAMKTADDLVASAEQSESVARGRYKAGVGTFADLLAAQSALATARQNRVTSLYNLYTSKFSLAQAMGQLDFGLIDNGSAQ